MKILISALEPSANLHLEPILDKKVRIVGIFDEKFGKPIYKSSDFSVMGILDVLGKVKLANKAIKEMTTLSKDVDKVLLIDSPAFNIPLAKSIKKHYPNKEIIYYILPKVWAWKKKRALEVRKYCDKLCSIFPFEKDFFENPIYVGNPLLDEINVYNDGKEKNQVAFLPGSRSGEIKRLMPIFKEVAKHIDKKKVLVIPKFFSKQKVAKLYKDISEFEISFDTHKSLAQSDFAFICSGTATLESAIIATPFVLAYKARNIDFWIGRKLVKLPFVGLANIILNFENKEPIHSEYLQDEVTVENLLKEYKNFKKDKFIKASLELKDILKHGSSKNMKKILIGE